MGDLMESHIPEKGFIAKMLLLLRLDKKTSHRAQNIPELGLHAVIELQAACPFGGMHPLVIREIDGNSLAPGIAVPGIIDGIIYSQVR